MKNSLTPASYLHIDPKSADLGLLKPLMHHKRVWIGFFNSVPWPLPSHPEAMKMEAVAWLTSALTGAIHT